MMLTPLALTLLSAPAVPDWPQLTGPLGDRTTAQTIDPASLRDAQAAWRIETQAGFSSFSVVGGRALTVVAREGKECLVALDAASGEERGSAPLGAAEYDGGGGAGAKDNRGGDGPRATPVVVGDAVYVYDAHLVVWCLDVTSGEVRWRRDLLADHEGRQIRWQNASAPVVVGDAVFVAGGGEGQTMMGLDARTGTPPHSSLSSPLLSPRHV